MLSKGNSRLKAADVRSFRQELEPQLEEFFGEAQRLTAAFDKTRKAVKDGLATLKTEAGPREASTDWSH